MSRRRITPVLAACLALGAAVAACAQPIPSASAPRGTSGPGGAELTVFAAASLRTATEQLTAAYTAEKPEARFRLSFGASDVLRVQIEHGAAADVFLSADVVNAEALVRARLADAEPAVFARAPLAIVRSDRAAAALRSGDPLALAAPGVRIAAAGPNVPISAYAERLYQALTARRGAPADFLERVRRNIVSREDNVAAVLARVELGEADAGIVYAPDARRAKRVVVIDAKEANAVRADYTAVTLAASPSPAASREFIAWLRGPRAAALLGDLGFQPAT
jgi:molybdate transport system substrate-binding protein